MRIIAVVSGGMDSVTMAWHLQSLGHELEVLSFDYGQRHVKELACAELCAKRLGVPFQKVDLSPLGRLLSSALTSYAIEVPDGHYEAETMRATVVPNRNAIMLTIAYGVAVSHGAGGVATAVHAGDHHIYPDCRPEFITAFETMQRFAIEGFGSVVLLSPFVNRTKAQIVALGHKLGMFWGDTWSCYKGGQYHCGTCGTCVERREAFVLAGVQDPTIYEEAKDVRNQ